MALLVSSKYIGRGVILNAFKVAIVAYVGNQAQDFSEGLLGRTFGADAAIPAPKFCDVQLRH